MSKELARRAVACEGWRWMPGMLCLTDKDGYAARILSVGLKASTSETADSYEEGGIITRGCIRDDSLPDLTDPATIGCLLALVREAFPERIVWTEIEYTTRQWIVVIMYNDGESGIFTRANTEAEALVDALEAVSDD